MLLLARFVALIGIFFFTSVVSVVTGSTSLITVPAMIAVGIEPHVAVATNMLALIFMSAGGSLPFVRGNLIPRKHLPTLLALTAIGSILGAVILLSISARSLQLTVAVAMVCIAAFVMWKPDMGEKELSPSSAAIFLGYLSTFLLSVYGGFFSGGYVTMLTAVFVAFFGMTFHQSVATTKVANIFSSVVATGIFLWRGIVDIRLGLVLGVAMFVGAAIGGQFALRMNAVWLRRAFVAAVLILAVVLGYRSGL